jgi:HCOMODA/2-hydroxy-3-carboxy-muconic semialdehyde decarboxylase
MNYAPEEEAMNQVEPSGGEVTRRAFLAGCSVVTMAAATSAQQAPEKAVGALPTTEGGASSLIHDLVAANRILADQGVVDAYGHISVRQDRDPGHYLMSRSLAPEMVAAGDIMEYDLNSNPVDARGRSLYVERFIHGEVYSARPDVKAIVHCHSPTVIPFSVSTFALRPLYHMSAFVGEGIPIFDIRDAAGVTDMLIRNPALGAALAQKLGSKPAVLMRGHGAVVTGSSLAQAVGRSVYLEINAKLQAQAMMLGGAIEYLDAGEARLAAPLDGYQRAWELWKRKVALP